MEQDPLAGEPSDSSAYWLEARTVSAILDSVSDGVLTYDHEFRVTSFNHAATSITGYSREEAIGRRCQDVFRCQECEQGCALNISRSALSPQTNYHLKLIRKDGAARMVTVNTIPMWDDRRSPGVVVTFRDITPLVTLRRDLDGRDAFHDIVSRNAAMRGLFGRVKEIGAFQSTVLITGESGTGKELFAKAIHHESGRRDSPFIKVNCLVFSENLLESELFGHIRGAYTGAVSDRMGRFELAQGGTIFLDEIGDLPQSIQIKLLRVLQDHEIERVGSSQVVKLDVRVIAATNRNLKELIARQNFREDLFYRLNVIPLNLPPLRERQDDVPLLVDHFIGEFNMIMGRHVEGISREAAAVLARYSWPGNIRQLENALEHAFVRTPGKTIPLEAFPDEIWRPDAPMQTGAGGGVSAWADHRNLGPLIPGDERAVLLAALQGNGWNVSRVARGLGVNRLTVYRRMKRHAITRTGS